MGLTRVGGVVLFAIVLVLVWLASPDLPGPMRLLAIVLAAVLPAVMLVQMPVAWQVPEGISRRSLYLSSSVTLWALAAVTLAVLWRSDYPFAGVGLTLPGPTALVGWSVAVLVAGLGWVALWRLVPSRETPLLRFLLPRSSAEKAAFVGVSITAGVCEELVFRGFLIVALHLMFGSLTAAVLLSSLIFGILHSYQGVLGILRTSVLGLFLALPFVATGSIVPSMIAHAAINIVIALVMADWLLRDGTLPAQAGRGGPAPGHGRQ